MSVKRNCEKCNKEFEISPSVKQKFCSRFCAYESRKEKTISARPNCMMCGKQVGPKGKKFCSPTCFSNSPLNKASGKKAGEKLKGRKLSSEQKKKISDKLTGSTHTAETKAKMSKTRKGRKKSKEHIKKIQDAIVTRVDSGIHKTGAWKKGSYRSTKTGRLESYDSSYELRRMKYLDASPLVKNWTKNHKIRIRYKEGRKRRKYIPDFLVERTDGQIFLDETKGFVWDRMNFARKNLAAMMYCRNRGITFRIIRESDLEVLV